VAAPSTEVNRYSFHSEPDLVPAHLLNRRTRPSVVQAGNVRSRRLRVVCAKCNNGWMSQLEHDVKGLLAGPIAGEEERLWSAADRIRIAVWIEKTCMVNEYSAPVVATTFPQRNHLMRTQHPSDGLAVWIAKSSSDFWGAGTIGNSVAIAPDRSRALRCNMLGLGGLVWLAFCSFGDGMPAAFNQIAVEASMSRLVPGLDNLDSRDLQTLEEQRLSKIYKAMVSALDRVGGQRG
jgi:hypothetical protein